MTMPTDREGPIAISGAGPAGLAAALTVARAGRRAVVYESRPTVGARFHDDFQGLENWTTQRDVLEELESIGIDTSFDHAPFRETVLFPPDGRERVYRSERPIYYLVRRGPGAGSLNRALEAQARAAGVEIRFGESRRSLPEGGIVADGPRGADAVAVGYVFETTAADGAYAAVSDRLAPQGYAYCLVWGGRATLASCIFDDFHNEAVYLDRTAGFFRDRLGITLTNARRFGGIGNYAVPSTAVQGTLLFAGEAAGFQDALWGFGMRYALLSGHLAARALLEGDPASYDRRWNERMGDLLRAGVVNRYLYARLGERGYVTLARRIARAGDARRWLRGRYRLTPVKRMLGPLARRRVGTRRRGAACAVDGCTCTWCRCQHEARTLRPAT